MGREPTGRGKEVKAIKIFFLCKTATGRHIILRSRLQTETYFGICYVLRLVPVRAQLY